MPNPTTTADLAARWRPLTTDELTVAETLLEDAWALLQARRPTLEADVTAGAVTEANVRRVVANMVLRVIKNPDGVLSESIDDYTYRRDSATSTGLLSVTADELADLTPGRRRRSSVRLVTHGEQ